MAAQKARDGADKKRKSRKKKARTEVSSSSESDSEVDSRCPSPPPIVQEAVAEEKTPSRPTAEATEKKKTKKKNKDKQSKATQEVQEAASDEPMQDAPLPPINTNQSDTKPAEDFSAIYLRKVAAEVADDLDKVREAPDFKASSVPMLIHALKQGQSLFSLDEKRRVVGAASS